MVVVDQQDLRVVQQHRPSAKLLPAGRRTGCWPGHRAASASAGNRLPDALRRSPSRTMRAPTPGRPSPGSRRSVSDGNTPLPPGSSWMPMASLLGSGERDRPPAEDAPSRAAVFRLGDDAQDLSTCRRRSCRATPARLRRGLLRRSRRTAPARSPLTVVDVGEMQHRDLVEVGSLLAAALRGVPPRGSRPPPRRGRRRSTKAHFAARALHRPRRRGWRARRWQATRCRRTSWRSPSRAGPPPGAEQEHVGQPRRPHPERPGDQGIALHRRGRR